MHVLYIAPLPPPINGHSLVSKAFFDELDSCHEVAVVNLSKHSFKEGVDSFKRIVEVLRILKEIQQKKHRVSAIYLTISESLAGNIKDLFIYVICMRSLAKMYIHLHGGSIKKLLWERHPFVFALNRFFLNKLAGVIVSGDSHLDIFKNVVPDYKIHVVPNFAPDYLFSTEEEIKKKFLDCQPLRVLYISNFIAKKGYNEVADAYLGLDSELKKKIAVDFAGRFETQAEEKTFLDKITGVKGIHYHGLVDDLTKKELFSKAHIFCLPTSFLEGQPISILEAYASGCVVLTTGQKGIRDIFINFQNGFEIQQQCVTSIQSISREISKKPNELLRIAQSNRLLADKKYRMTSYNHASAPVIKTLLKNAP